MEVPKLGKPSQVSLQGSATLMREFFVFVFFRSINIVVCCKSHITTFHMFTTLDVSRSLQAKVMHYVWIVDETECFVFQLQQCHLEETRRDFL